MSSCRTCEDFAGAGMTCPGRQCSLQDEFEVKPNSESAFLGEIVTVTAEQYKVKT